MPAEDLTGSGQGNIGCTVMTHTVMVPDGSSTALQPAMDTSPRQETHFSSSLAGATPTVEKTEVDGVSALRTLGMTLEV